LNLPALNGILAVGAGAYATLAAAFAALPASGGTIQLNQDLTLAGTQLFAIPNNGVINSFTLDLAGHTINCANTASYCIGVTTTNIGGGAVRIAVKNGTINYAGSSTGVVGLQVFNVATTTDINNLLISNFSYSGDTCLVFSNAESITVTGGTRLSNCYNGEYVSNLSTNIIHTGMIINYGTAGLPIRIDSGSEGIDYYGGLIQTSSNQNAVVIDSTAAQVNGFGFHGTWFENIGDGTAASSVFNFTGTHNIFDFECNDCRFYPDANGVAGSVLNFATTGGGLVSSPQMSNEITYYPVWAQGNSAFPLSLLSGNTGASAGFADAGFNIGGISGLHLWPQTGSHHYNMWAGDSGYRGDVNNLSITDSTAGTTPLHYVASTQTMTFINAQAQSILGIFTPSTSGTPITSLCPNMPSPGYCDFFIGAAETAYNSAHIIFENPGGAGSSSNYMLLGPTGHENLQLNGNGLAQFFGTLQAHLANLPGSGNYLVGVDSSGDFLSQQKSLVGAGTGVPTGPAVTTTGDCVKFADTAGTIADQGAPCSASASGVSSINGSAGAFTFGGAGVSCTLTTCTFTGTSPGIGSITWAIPAWLTASPSSISASGTQTFSPTTAQTSHQVIGTCGSATTFGPCALVAADLPTVTTATNLAAATQYCAPYQSAAGTTGCFVPGTTNLHTYVYAWQTNGSLVAPSGVDITALMVGNRPWLGCQPGRGDGLNAVPAGTYLTSTCKNTTGVSVTITGVQCFSDNNGGSTLNVVGNTLGGLLTGAVTCTNAFAAGTQSANVTLTNNDYLKFTWVADGITKQSTWVVTGTY
jgi:hypothetical protein